jgi:phosphonate transport system ATP-binding protein
VTRSSGSRSLTKHFAGGVVALDGATGSLCRGERVAVIGPSGAGKSTLLRCLNRLNDATSGSITLNGRDVTRVNGSGLRSLRHEVGMIFQQFNLVGRLTVLQNVLAGRLRFTVSPIRAVGSLVRSFSESDHSSAMNALRHVGVAEQARKRADELSGGQQQRVAIARVLCQEPSVVLADEPIASLDPRSAEVVMNTLRDIAEQRGIPVMVNLHHIDVARSFATRVIGMNAGRIVFDAPPSELDDDAISAIYRDSRDELVEAPDTGRNSQ